MTLQTNAVTEALNPSQIYIPSYKEDLTSLSRNADRLSVHIDPLTAKRAGMNKGDKVSATMDAKNWQIIIRIDPNSGRTLSQHAPHNGREYDLYAQFPYHAFGAINRIATKKTPHKPSIVTTGYIAIPLTDDWLPPEPQVSATLFEDQAFEQAKTIADLNAKLLASDIEEAILNAYFQGMEDAEKSLELEDASIDELLGEIARRHAA